MEKSPLVLRTWRLQGNTRCWSSLLVMQLRWSSTTRLCAMRKSSPRMGFFTLAISKSHVYLQRWNWSGIILTVSEYPGSPGSNEVMLRGREAARGDAGTWVHAGGGNVVDQHGDERELILEPQQAPGLRLEAGSWDGTEPEPEAEAGASVPEPELLANRKAGGGRL